MAKIPYFDSFGVVLPHFCPDECDITATAPDSLTAVCPKEKREKHVILARGSGPVGKCTHQLKGL